MKKQTAYILIVALIALQIYSLTQIISLQNDLENTQETLHSIDNRLNSQISNIYHTITKKLEEEASKIHTSSVTVGALNTDTLKVPITFTVEPKTITESLEVLLDFDGEIISLEQSGTQFFVTKDLGISETAFPKIILQDQGVKHLEEHRGLNVSRIKESIFPNIFAHFSGTTKYSSGEYSEKGFIDIEYIGANEDNYFKEMKYVVKVDNKKINEKMISIVDEKQNINSISIEIDGEYSLEKGQTLTGNIVAIDALGFVHEYLVVHYVGDSNDQREPYSDKLSIKAPNGETVYLFDEMDYKNHN
ncbi:MAG TPA: hypothetical protein VJ962_12735 [Clostridia bacterium]|nr:hypothetical protein [Clostridia bacterium]